MESIAAKFGTFQRYCTCGTARCVGPVQMSQPPVKRKAEDQDGPKLDLQQQAQHWHQVLEGRTKLYLARLLLLDLIEMIPNIHVLLVDDMNGPCGISLNTFHAAGYNNIGDDGARALAEALKHNATLTELTIDRCWLLD